MATALTNNKASFVKIYKSELDGKVRERMLLVLDVVYHGKIASHVARDLHRNRSCACKWLKRYDKDGVEGLKNKPKSGRPTELSEEMEYEIKTILRDSNHGWTTKQVEELIIKETGIKYHYTRIYRILRRWGFKQKVPRKVYVNIASSKGKDEFKKKVKQIFVGTSSSSSHQHQKKKRKKDFTIVSQDESFFFYDSLVKMVWIEESKRPVVKIIRSHQYFCFFGAVDIKGKQHFRQYNKFNTKPSSTF